MDFIIYTGASFYEPCLRAYANLIADIPEYFKDLANVAYNPSNPIDVYRHQLIHRTIKGYEQQNPLSIKDIYEYTKKRFDETKKWIGVNSSFIVFSDFEEKIQNLIGVKKIIVYGTKDDEYDVVFPALTTKEDENRKILLS